MNRTSVARDVLFDLLLALRLTSATVSNTGLLTILTFHRVLPLNLRIEYPLPVLVTSPEELHWILSTLLQFYEIGALTGMLLKLKNNEKSEKPLMAITFDDGQEDNYRYAVPVLNKLGIKATFFIPVSTVNEGGVLWHDLLGFSILHLFGNSPGLSKINEFLNIDLTSCRSRFEAARLAISKAKLLDHHKRLELIRKYTTISHCPDWAGVMTWEQLQKMADDGHEIGSHSMTHPILPKCSEAELRTEIGESRTTIQAKLDISVSSFCYPNGDFDKRVEAFTESAGYTCAVMTRSKANHTGDSPFSLGRCGINPGGLKNSKGELSPARLAWRLSSLKRLVEKPY
jgi:peptidoglycan/xylan/chitin deacetylase (PgdA/CDA1 family)